MTSRKLTRSHRRMNTVKCECGAEILFLPDGRAMGQAIEAHVAAVHMQKSKDPAGAAAEAERIRDALIAQVLSIASKLGNDGSHE